MSLIYEEKYRILLNELHMEEFFYTTSTRDYHDIAHTREDCFRITAEPVDILLVRPAVIHPHFRVDEVEMILCFLPFNYPFISKLIVVLSRNTAVSYDFFSRLDLCGLYYTGLGVRK